VAEQVESEALSMVPAPQLEAMRDQLTGLLRHLRSASSEAAQALAELPAARVAGREPAAPRRAPRHLRTVKSRDGAA
jgi:hypothetical protein